MLFRFQIMFEQIIILYSKINKQHGWIWKLYVFWVNCNLFVLLIVRFKETVNSSICIWPSSIIEYYALTLTLYYTLTSKCISRNGRFSWNVNTFNMQQFVWDFQQKPSHEFIILLKQKTIGIDCGSQLQCVVGIFMKPLTSDYFIFLLLCLFVVVYWLVLKWKWYTSKSAIIHISVVNLCWSLKRFMLKWEIHMWCDKNNNNNNTHHVITILN